jgi:hypothetical protein
VPLLDAARVDLGWAGDETVANGSRDCLSLAGVEGGITQRREGGRKHDGNCAKYRDVERMGFAKKRDRYVICSLTRMQSRSLNPQNILVHHGNLHYDLVNPTTPQHGEEEQAIGCARHLSG